MIKKIKITESQFRKLVEMEHLADLGTDYPLDENKKETIGRILREELNKPIRRRINFSNIDGIIKKHRMGSFLKNEPVEKSIDKTILQTMYQVMPRDSEDYDVDYHKAWDEIKTYIRNNYSEELRQYFEKRQKDSDEDKNPLGIKYIFVKHDKPYYDSGWRGFADGFDSFDEMITKYGDWVDVDWDEVKNKLDKINDYPESTFTGTMKSRPLRISNIGDEGNSWGYNFSIIKSIPEENLDKILKEGLHDTSWENGMGEKYYISWDENYGKSFKLVKTPYGAQSGGKWEPNLVSIVTPENTNAWYEWEELSDEKLDMWKENWDNIQKTLGNHKYNQIIRNM